MVFRYILLLSLVALLGSPGGLSYASELLDSSSQSQPEPVAEALRRGCESSVDCLLNEYCGGRGPSKRCIQCFDCATVRRKGRMRTYDGQNCAAHQTDCGECEWRHREVGGVCIPEESIATTPSPVPPPASPPPRIINVGGRTDHHPQMEDKANKSSLGPIFIGILAVLLGISIVALGIYIIRIRHLSCRAKPSIDTSRDEEAADLYRDDGSYENPTAPPPEEYRPQPALYVPPTTPSVPRNSILSSGGPILPRRDQAETANALPFARGNGAGAWTVTSENAPVEQTGDGNGSQNQQLRLATTDSSAPLRSDDTVDASNNNNRNDSPSQVREEGNPGPPRSVGGQNVRIPHLNGPLTSSPRPSIEGSSSNRMNNPIVGTLSLAIYFQGVFRTTPATNATQGFSPGPQNPQVRMAISAPPSPRGAVDDTFLENLLSLREPFLPSNLSLDSGTGSVHDSSVSSRSASGGDVRGSDMDDSMLGDDDRRVVPDFNQPSENQLDIDEMELDALYP